MAEELKGNGVAIRIKHVLDANKDISQPLVNTLLLEVMLEISAQVAQIGVYMEQHGQEHENIGDSHGARLAQIEKHFSDLETRIKRIEDTVWWPIRHPKTSAVIGFVFLIMANLWFISGFRRLVLQIFNAPDWLINLLAAGTVGP